MVMSSIIPICNVFKIFFRVLAPYLKFCLRLAKKTPVPSGLKTEASYHGEQWSVL